MASEESRDHNDPDQNDDLDQNGSEAVLLAELKETGFVADRAVSGEPAFPSGANKMTQAERESALVAWSEFEYDMRGRLVMPNAALVYTKSDLRKQIASARKRANRDPALRTVDARKAAAAADPLVREIEETLTTLDLVVSTQNARLERAKNVIRLLRGLIASYDAASPAREARTRPRRTQPDGTTARRRTRPRRAHGALARSIEATKAADDSIQKE